MLAEYECIKCKHKWKQNPIMVKCLVCHHDYIKWVNYEKWRKNMDHEIFIKKVIKRHSGKGEWIPYVILEKLFKRDIIQAYDASTPEKFLKSCLKIITNRYNEKYYTKPSDKFVRDITPDLTAEEVKELPKGTVKGIAKGQHDRYNEEMNKFKNQLVQYDKIKKVVKNKDEKLAYECFQLLRFDERTELILTPIEMVSE